MPTEISLSPRNDGVLRASRESLLEQVKHLFDIHDNVSRVIRDLNFLIEGLDERDDDRFEFESMMRVYLYMKTAGYSQSTTAERIDSWPYLRLRFGIDKDRNLSQQVISHFKRNRASYALRVFLEELAEGIREVGREREVNLSELPAPEPDPNEVNQENGSDPIHHYVDKHARSIITTGVEQIFPALDTGRANNLIHEDKQLWKQQLLMSLMDRAGTRAAYRTFNKFYGNPAHHDTHTRGVKKLGTPSGQSTLDEFRNGGAGVPEWRRITDAIQAEFSDAVGRMIDFMKEESMFSPPVDVAIDTTFVPYHVTPYKGEEEIKEDDERIVVNEKTGTTRVPKDDYPEMVKGGEERGVYGFEYATLTIVGRDTPIVLAVEPVRHNSRWEENGETVAYAEVVDRLMEQASQHVDIQLVMADKAFGGDAVKHVLDQNHDVTYLLPQAERSEHLKAQADEVKHDPKIKSRVERGCPILLNNETSYIGTCNDPTVGESGFSHEACYMYVPAEKDDWAVTKWDGTEYAIFATNRDELDPMLAKGFADQYSSRWDIENEYKNIKPLVPSISSKDYRMRLFSFVFSCMLYNLWRITDHSLKILARERFDEYGRENDEERLDPLLPLADLLASSLVLLFTDGLDPPDS